MAKFPTSRYEPHEAERGDTSQPGTAKGQTTLRYGFTKGMDRSVSPALIEEGACRFVQNLYYPRETAALRTRWGLTQYSTGASPLPGKVRAVCVYEKDASTTYTVVVAENDVAAPDDLLVYYLDANEEPVQIYVDPTDAAVGLGSMVTPTFQVMNGRLIIAVPDTYLFEWAGDITDGSGAVQSTAAVTFTNVPAVQDTVTIGNRTFTFWTERSQPGEVAIGGTESECATNLAAAIATDSWDVKAVANTDTVNLTARRYGVGGDSYDLATSNATDIDVTTSPWSGGTDGAVLDVIDSYQAPKSGIITTDRNRRLVAWGDETEVDRLFFSAPANEWNWAEPDFGNGQYIDIGAQEGNLPSAVVPFLDEVWVHKWGQNREIYRARVADPDPNNWEVQTRPHDDTTSAMNPRCAASVAEQHVLIDRDFLGTYSGTDTYDEVRAGMDGNKVYDLLTGMDPDTAFIVKHPADRVLLIFPKEGKFCLVYHYGSRRWSSFRFGLELTCGEYHEGEGKMIFGCSDGYLYAEDTSVATDAGTAFQGIVTGKTMISDGLEKINLLQTFVDFENVRAGGGAFGICVNRSDNMESRLFEFDTFTAQKRIYEYLTDEIFTYAAAHISDVAFGRIGSYEQANGEAIAPQVLLNSGAFVLYEVLMRVTNYGRAAE